MKDTSLPMVMAGIPSTNMALYHRTRFMVGDPVALIDWNVSGNSSPKSTLILRDIEMDRARKNARVQEVFCPNHFRPEQGLSGDRETATAQATAECLRRAGVKRVVGDRTLPLAFIYELNQAQITVEYDPDLGTLCRRVKDKDESRFLQEAQRATESAIELACKMIARATPNASGVLQTGNMPLTPDRVRSMIDLSLTQRGFATPHTSIVAGGIEASDCHQIGSAPLRTGEPIIVDVFPKSTKTHYFGDCTRTIVHGDIPSEVARAHAAVVAAKRAAIQATRSGVTGESVHAATTKVIQEHGYHLGLTADGLPHPDGAMVHGTGHGIGLDVHEPPLLDMNGPKLLHGDVLTIEPGIYSPRWGGVRIEDMVYVTDQGCLNFNQLPEGLTWEG